MKFKRGRPLALQEEESGERVSGKKERAREKREWRKVLGDPYVTPFTEEMIKQLHLTLKHFQSLLHSPEPTRFRQQLRFRNLYGGFQNQPFGSTELETLPSNSFAQIPKPNISVPEPDTLSG